jgi:hypothetical protein
MPQKLPPLTTRQRLRIAYYRAKGLYCRLAGHTWSEDVLWIAGQRCSSGLQCDRCRDVPQGVGGLR